MNLYRPDDREETSVPLGQVHVDGPPRRDGPPAPNPPQRHPAGPYDASVTQTPWATPPGQRRRTRTAWLVGAGVTCLVVIATLLGVRSWGLDGQVSDLTEENGTLAAQNDALDGKVAELAAARDAIRRNFPISQESLADADLVGTYDFLFVPVEGKCTYSDCDQVGSERYQLSIGRTSDGYALALEGAPAPPVPMSREGNVYSASGVLPESMWGTCGDAPAATNFELHLTVAAVGLAGSDLRAVEAGGTYRQYTPDAGLGCESSESASTFTARRTG